MPRPNPAWRLVLLVLPAFAGSAAAQSPGELATFRRRPVPAYPAPLFPAPYYPAPAPAYPAAPVYPAPAPAAPLGPTQGAPAAPATPGTPESPAPQTPAAPESPAAPQTPAAPETPAPQTPDVPTDAASEAGLDAGSDSLANSFVVNNVGRADTYNRFNFFDNSSAIVQNRAWLAYQRMDGYDVFKFNPRVSFIQVPVTTQRVVPVPQTTLPRNTVPNVISTYYGNFYQSYYGGIGGIGGYGGGQTSGATPPSFIGSAPANAQGRVVTETRLETRRVVEDIPDIRSERDASQYRFGFEYALSDNFSIAAQGMYIDYEGDGNPSAFGNPQVMFKWAMLNLPGTVFSPIVSLQIPIDGVTSDLIREPTLRIAPGALLYQELGDVMFYQGGVQYNASTTRFQTSFDWTANLGLWLYRADGRDIANRGATASGLGGVVFQSGLYGAHVLAREGVPVFLPGGELVHVVQPSDILDASTGVTVFLGRANLTLGLSVPLTKSDVRRFEFVSNLNWNF